MRACILIALLLLASMPAHAQKAYTVKSPDGRLELTLTAGPELTWSVSHEGVPVITPSAIGLTLDTGEVLGERPAVSGTKSTSVNEVITPPVYKKKTIEDRYNQLTVSLRGGYGVILRAYNDGAAYRFVLQRKGDLTVKGESVNFNFAGDPVAHAAFDRDFRNGDPYMSSWEAPYEAQKISAMRRDTLIYAPVLVELEGRRRAVILEADLEAYPGMLLRADERGFRGAFAPYPVREEVKQRNFIVPEREEGIAHISGMRMLPWRGVAVATHDRELLNSDLVYKLAAPSRLQDVSWIKPGKVAWDWWNDWNLRGVDFRTGVNNPTYRFYIDFAAANGLEYLIMDEGWSVPGDLSKTIPEIDLPDLISYARGKGVDIILWSNWKDIRGREDELFQKYADMGIKGFKVDFFDRNDQVVVESVYEISRKAAEHRLLLDYHGFYQPTGLQRTYPNVINSEGVKGMEYVKWSRLDDVPLFDVTMPYIRMLAGPIDYTPGAMRNATRRDYRPSNSTPMSHGTRVHQMAMFTAFEAPLQMLADSPTSYMAEQECMDFIAAVPTVFDETVALDGRVGESLALARRKGDTWFVAAMTNSDARRMDLDLSFLGPGQFEAVIFRDGVNADRDARDYKRIVQRVSAADRLSIEMAEAGGWTARISPVR